MFKIGDRVTSKKTGLPMTGTVVGCLHPIGFSAQVKAPMDTLNERCKRWTDLYPDWSSKMLWYVLFDHPAKALSFEDYLIAVPDGNKGHYELTTPVVQIASYPEDDLEEIENDENQCWNPPEEITPPITDS